MTRLTAEQVETIRRVREAGGSYREAARRAGCAASTIGAYFPDSRIEVDDPASEPGPNVVVREAGDSRTVEYASPHRIKTLEDAVAFAEVDLATWRVKSWECTSWEVVMKIKAKDASDRAERHGLWRVSLKLERLFPKHLMDGLDLVWKRFESKTLRFDRPYVPARRSGGSMIEINIPDLHLGKLCWRPETGHDYDVRIAEAVYEDAAAELQQRAKGFDVDQAVFLIGSDFFHVDTLANTTTAGTHVDTDGRYAKMIEVGEMAVIRAVDRLADACRNVKVIWVPGNHDRLSSYHLARTIAAWFRNDDRVEVDYGPAVRKYFRYGVNLLGYTHGDKIKREKLPLIMATERKEDWAATTCREWHVGHAHTSKSFETMACDEYAGVRVKVVPSLCGTDAWHSENGFIGNTRAAEAFVYERDHGLVANFTAVARACV